MRDDEVRRTILVFDFVAEVKVLAAMWHEGYWSGLKTESPIWTLLGQSVRISSCTIPADDLNTASLLSIVNSVLMIRLVMQCLGASILRRFIPMRVSLVFLVLVSACSNGTDQGLPEEETSLYFCFDDSTIDEWFDARDLFDAYDVKATFYITRFTMLSAAQIEKLHVLESDGHSIQFHSTFHRYAVEYLETHTIDEYIENEVYIGLDAMREAGFHPVSFAYPGGSHTPTLDAACLTIFDTLRVSDREGPNILLSVGIDNREIESVVANPPEIMHSHRITDEDSDYTISRDELEYMFRELVADGYRFDVITNRNGN